MCYICEERGEVGKRYKATQQLCKPVGHDLNADFEGFKRPDWTKRPPTLAQQRRTLFRKGPIGKATYCPATLPLFPYA